jgi:hypothetical protein
MELAARTADLIFTAQDTIPEGRAFRDSIHARMEKYGRRPDEIRVFPGIQPIIGRTLSEAQEKYEELRALVDDGVGIAAVARLAGGVDIFSLDPDGPLPPLKPSNAARARQDRIIAMGKRGMSIREIGRVLAMSQTHRVIWGTPQSIADDLTEWLEQGAADGFNLLFAHYPKPLEEWVDMVIPPSCSGAAGSAPSTRARPSAAISACRSRRTGSARTARACRSMRRRPMTKTPFRRYAPPSPADGERHESFLPPSAGGGAASYAAEGGYAR